MDPRFSCRPTEHDYLNCTECPVCGTDSCEALEQLGMLCDTMNAATIATRRAHAAARTAGKNADERNAGHATGEPPHRGRRAA